MPSYYQKSDKEKSILLFTPLFQLSFEMHFYSDLSYMYYCPGKLLTAPNWIYFIVQTVGAQNKQNTKRFTQIRQPVLDLNRDIETPTHFYYIEE